MSGYWTNDGGNAALEYLLRTTPVYFSMHTAEPTVVAGTNASSEVAGGGYQRQKCWFTAVGSKTTALGGGYSTVDGSTTTLLKFESMPTCVVYWFGVWDTLSGGHQLFAIQRTLSDGVTPAPLTVASNQTVTIPANDVVIGPV